MFFGDIYPFSLFEPVAIAGGSCRVQRKGRHWGAVKVTSSRRDPLWGVTRSWPHLGIPERNGHVLLILYRLYLSIHLSIYLSIYLYIYILYPTLHYSTLLYSPLLYSTLLSSTLLYCTLLYSTLLSSTLISSTLLYSPLLYSTLLSSTLLSSPLLYSTLLYSTVLSSPLLYYSTLLYSTLLTVKSTRNGPFSIAMLNDRRVIISGLWGSQMLTTKFHYAACQQWP